MSGIFWRFFSKKSGFNILVHDAQSAEHLKLLIQTLDDCADWEFQKWEGDSQVSNTNTSPQESGWRNRRQHERFALKFRVIFTCDKLTFRTFTQDLSEGGMRLQQKLPAAFVGQTCKVFIGHPNRVENLEMHCKVLLDDPKSPQRVRFTNCPREAIDTLSLWMLESRKQAMLAA